MTKPAAKLHDWVQSTLGHGEVMCSKCFVTNREAAVLGLLNRCDRPDTTPAQPLQKATQP